MSVIAIAFGVFALLYAVLAVEHAFALASGRLDLATHLTARLTSDGFIFGSGSLRYIVPWYEKAAGRMGTHIGLGGIALGLGILQFVPSLRRRHPRLHRFAGLAVWIAVLASMIGAIGFLIFIPMRQGASGVVFHMGLWALDLLTLGLLYQAILAALARDFRSHMVWMSMVFAAIATAPMLRLDWVVFAHLWPQQGHEIINLATSTFVLLQTVTIMTLWLGWVGDRDLPARSSSAISAWPQWVIVALSALSALAAIQESWLVRAGFDLFHSVRDARDVFPPGAILWSLTMLVGMALAPRAWRNALTGARPSIFTTVVIMGVALGSMAIGLEYDRASLVRVGISTFWTAYGLLLVTAIVLAHVIRPTSLGRNAWTLIAIALMWLPSQLLGLIVLGLSFGATFTEAMGAALVIGVGGLVVAGAATGFGAKLRWAPVRRANARKVTGTLPETAASGILGTHY